MSDFAEKKAEEEEVHKVEKTEEGGDEDGDDGPAPVSAVASQYFIFELLHPL